MKRKLFNRKKSIRIFSCEKNDNKMKNTKNMDFINVTNCEVCGFMLIHNKQSRFHFDRIDFTNHWMLYYKGGIQFRLIVEIFKMFLKKENSVCYILVFILVCLQAFWLVCEFSGLFANFLVCLQVFWLVCEYRRVYHITLLYKFLIDIYSFWRVPAQSNGFFFDSFFFGS